MANPTGIFPHLCLLILTLITLATATTTTTDPTTTATTTSTATASIYTSPSNGFSYIGCYNETTDLAGTAGNRALYGGTNEVLPGNMTVQTCQAFCRASGSVYKFAGLEYARECWCASQLSSLSKQFPDSACNLTCEGDATQICGGSLKITVS
ncbi:WSC domain-containing protein [Lasiosphaeria miniovina]|uniref:WSC domain-containing protein n=1 Tax=Lasiosphaeria miniovina TaxID=1954250 RepID=A0AA40EFL2_9PEZI|nr:WSC domain-containing protein [Lasiosphaeria miniovina]KAK0733413.1 WSC domain-containing protein [Lasiosphaeria miniovina]